MPQRFRLALAVSLELFQLLQDPFQFIGTQKQSRSRPQPFPLRTLLAFVHIRLLQKLCLLPSPRSLPQH
jgi:hypothetical protein